MRVTHDSKSDKLVALMVWHRKYFYDQQEASTYRVGFAIFLYEEAYPQTWLFSCMLGSCRRAFFSENGAPRNEEIL